jgi:plasmid stability protein
MPDLIIHDIPDETFDALAAHAARRGRSVEAAVGELIREAASKERLMQGIETISQASDTVDAIVGPRSEPDAKPAKTRRRYRAPQPKPTRHGR